MPSDFTRVSNPETSYAPEAVFTPQSLLDAMEAPGASYEGLARKAEERWRQNHDVDWLIPWSLSLWRARDYAASLEVLELGKEKLRSSVDYLTLRGMVLRRLPGRQSEACSSYKSALAIAPYRSDIYFNMGNILREDLQEYELAVRSYQLSLQLDPNSSRGWLNYAIALQEVDRLDDSARAHVNGLCLDPLNADAWNNAGLCALADGLIDKALQFFLYSLSLDCNSSAAFINAGNALVELLSPQDALTYLDRAIELEGGSNASANALWNTSLVRLLMGEYRIGWSLYEARFRTKQFEGTFIPSIGPRVTCLSELPPSNAASSDHLLIWSEQGIGDSIQFCRYLLLLKERGVPFSYQAPASLVLLMRNWLGLGEAVVDSKSSNPSNDSRPHVPLLSLPNLFGTELDTVPVLSGYLSSPGPAPPSLLVSPPPGGISIGIVWASNPDNKAMYRKKSIPLDFLMPRLVDLMDLDLAEVHSLQVGEDADQIISWSEHPRLTNWNGLLGDFSDTAYVVQQLDLVIAVDTAVAHLSAALNRPTWLLLPANADFRCLRACSDSPWYPSMRMFRQCYRNDWISVVSHVHRALDQLVLLDIGSLVSSRSSSQLKRVS